MNDIERKIESAIERLNGADRYLRPCLQPEQILRRMCRNAELIAYQEGTEPWVIVKRFTGHGSGVSSAIYEVYKGENDD